MESSHPKCDVCGKPATSLARDVYQTEPDEGFETFRPGPMKAGCAEHPAESLEYDRNGELVGPTRNRNPLGH